ncbi:MmcQ/YjbR family DNA-binding protein [Lewinella sp. 4G2]|uniref:MmcQ/YjbR family DNA-binding protein n=1 Tax=Lewinella sp. 4G2 TaxID=1803372 RepID=UPI0007B4DA93|nr:MmcQ/YjbR family DNA-binding protein [Lewinella sp. 4G2]OAV46283.1 MmcQ-like protein [Lewinella sp. 4G2]
MTIDDLREYILAKPHTTEGIPFGPTALVFKVGGKMFGVISLDSEDLRINLKCDPERAIDLRERYPAIRGAWHMNKTHWNSLYIDEGDLRQDLVFELIDHSHDLVVAKMTKKLRTELGL